MKSQATAVSMAELSKPFFNFFGIIFHTKMYVLSIRA